MKDLLTLRHESPSIPAKLGPPGPRTRRGVSSVSPSWNRKHRGPRGAPTDVGKTGPFSCPPHLSSHRQCPSSVPGGGPPHTERDSGPAPSRLLEGHDLGLRPSGSQARGSPFPGQPSRKATGGRCWDIYIPEEGQPPHLVHAELPGQGAMGPGQDQSALEASQSRKEGLRPNANPGNTPSSPPSPRPGVSGHIINSSP